MARLTLARKISNAILPAPEKVVSKAASEKPTKVADITLDDLKTAYLLTAVANRAIRVRANFMLSRDYNIEYPDKRSEKIITEFLKNVKKNDFWNLDLKSILRQYAIDTDVFGNGYRHLVLNKAQTKYVKLAPRHPLYMDLQRDDPKDEIKLDEYGLPVGYAYTSKDEVNPTPFGREEIAHLVFETLGDEFLGISILQPAFKTIERLTNIEFGTAQALYKHGFPTVKASIGDERHPPTQDDIDDALTQLKGVMSQSEYAHPYWQEIETLDPKFPAKIDTILRYFAAQVVMATDVPAFLILGEERVATRSTADKLFVSLFRSLEFPQDRIKSMVENQIFRPVLDKEDCDSQPELVWSEKTFPLDPDIANKILKLSNVIIEGRPIISWKEARGWLKLPTSVKPTIEAETLSKMWGLYLVEPHGELISSGAKRAIVKSKKFTAHIGEPLFLLSGNFCYGIIQLDSPVEINLEQFKTLQKKHRVTGEERKKWWPQATKLYYYPFQVKNFFDPPKRWKFKKGIQVFVKDVEFEPLR